MHAHDSEVTHSSKKLARNVIARTRLLRTNVRKMRKYRGRIGLAAVEVIVARLILRI
ncbi:MAG TPA: hypothetical protein VKB78_10220 [Pirellulales bacterium]|nr:hypothetical protein [Pirellulales bacterium]